VGVFKPLIMTCKKWKHGHDTQACTCAYKTVSSFLLVESNGRDSCATSRDTRDAHIILLIRSCLPEGLTIS
jgi:hypothetical protein